MWGHVDDILVSGKESVSVQTGPGGVDWTGHTTILLWFPDWSGCRRWLLLESGEVHQGDRGGAAGQGC